MAPWRYKPPAGSRFDYRDPMSRGLLRSWVLNERSGLQTQDMVTGRIGTFPSGVTLNENGATVASHSSTNCIILEYGAIVGALPCWTIALKMNSTDGSGNGIALYCERDAPTGNGICKVDFNRSSAHVAEITYRDSTGAGLLQLGGTTSVDDGTDHYIVATRSGTTFTLYVDFAQEAQNTGATSSTTFSASSIEARLFGDANDSAAAMQGSIYWCHLWNRAISVGEMRRLKQDPYFSVMAPEFWMYGTAAAASYIPYRPSQPVIGFLPWGA